MSPAAGREPDLSPSSGKRWRVLLIDDSEITLDYQRGLLETGGFEVKTCTELDRLQDILQSWVPEVIVTDVNMPGMSGVELCEYLKDRYETAHVPVVLCSGLEESVLAEQAHNCSANGYISKVNGMDGLASELRALCDTVIW